jgi:hypothetical protein
MLVIVQVSSRATTDSNVGNLDRENGIAIIWVKMSIFVPPSATKPDVDHRSSFVSRICFSEPFCC